MWIAAFAPKKRKKAFEKRLCMTVDAAKLKFNESAPPALKKFLPYDLKVEWVSEAETTDSFFEDNQVVVYVNSYKDEVKQAVGILHNYCAKGFGQNAKTYMPASVCKSSDLIVTNSRKLIQMVCFSLSYLMRLINTQAEFFLHHRPTKFLRLLSILWILFMELHLTHRKMTQN